MYTNSGSVCAAGASATAAGACAEPVLPDTGGLGLLALLTPETPLGVLFLVMAVWALVGACFALWRMVPRREA